MRVVAKETVLGTALDTGDVYTEDAKDIFRLPKHLTKCSCKGPCADTTNHIKKRPRQQAKIGHLAFQYACGLSKFYQQMLEEDRELPFGVAKMVFEALRARYWPTVAYWKTEYERVLATGYSETRLSKRRRVYPAPPSITETSNWPIQATAADVMNIGTLDLWERLRRFNGEARIIIQLHDALDVECKAEIKQDVIQEMKAAMEQPHVIEGATWSFPIEVKSGQRWSDV